MRNRKRWPSNVLWGILISVLFVSASVAENVPVLLSLKLGKDTLALAEPVYLTAIITNNLGGDVILNNFHMFGLTQSSYPFSLYLVTPDGKKWPFVGPRGRVGVTPIPSPKFWLQLPPGTSASKGKILFWACFVPPEYQSALEELPSGTYKLFATYTLPKQDRLEAFDDRTVYSDTVEFVFLPLDPENWPQRGALADMNSLKKFFNIGDKMSVVRPVMQRIIESNTPYSEVAHAYLSAAWDLDADVLITEKARFDNLYPESQFQSYLLREQYWRSYNAGILDGLDSLDRFLLKLEPAHSETLLRRGTIYHPGTQEDAK